MKAMITITNLHKKFNPGTINEVYALRGINLHINAGDFITIIGTNGSGKTSLLNAVAGSFLPDSGQILLEGRNITRMPGFRRSRYISRVFQNPYMGTAADMSIAENLHMAYLRSRRALPLLGLNFARRDYFRGEVRPLRRPAFPRQGRRGHRGGTRRPSALDDRDGGPLGRLGPVVRALSRHGAALQRGGRATGAERPPAEAEQRRASRRSGGVGRFRHTGAVPVPGRPDRRAAGRRHDRAPTCELG